MCQVCNQWECFWELTYEYRGVKNYYIINETFGINIREQSE